MLFFNKSNFYILNLSFQKLYNSFFISQYILNDSYIISYVNLSNALKDYLDLNVYFSLFLPLSKKLSFLFLNV